MEGDQKIMSGARVKFWCIFLRCRFGISPNDWKKTWEPFNINISQKKWSRCFQTAALCHFEGTPQNKIYLQFPGLHSPSTKASALATSLAPLDPTVQSNVPLSEPLEGRSLERCCMGNKRGLFCSSCFAVPYKENPGFPSKLPKNRVTKKELTISRILGSLGYDIYLYLFSVRFHLMILVLILRKRNLMNQMLVGVHGLTRSVHMICCLHKGCNYSHNTEMLLEFNSVSTKWLFLHSCISYLLNLTLHIIQLVYLFPPKAKLR